MPTIEEFDVVIKRYTYNELKELLGDGKRQVNLTIEYTVDGGKRKFMSGNMELVVETWERKPEKK